MKSFHMDRSRVRIRVTVPLRCVKNGHRYELLMSFKIAQRV